MGFKINKTSSLSLESPELLFRDIKTKKVHGPLADQADLWRIYMEKAIQASDVALQLPTGGGKTLVGLVIAEWRRQKFKERVVFLCPNKQLVNQVVDQAVNHYGIKVHGFTGSKTQYDKAAVAEYQNCERVAITTYSSLFNSYPFFDDPQVILLDDAHASEQFIASMWSLNINSFDINQKPLYESLISILQPVIDKADFQRLVEPDSSFRDIGWVEKIPSPTFLELIPEIMGVIDAFTSDPTYDVADHRFVWRIIRDHLEACHLYIGAGSLLIRPLLPPTNTHRAFSGAKQRIYMSATFGEAGELERITGRKKIERLESKSSWERQSIGRRYFLFPERSLNEDQQLELCGKLIKQAGRALVLAPDRKRADKFTIFVKEELGLPVFNAQDIELSKAEFIQAREAVAIVANRYDGIDFPESQCRLSIIEGLPRATNLQEQFLVTKMGAVDLLSVRITTRLVQAFGRCTRSDQDYSAIVIRGEELNKYLMTPIRRSYLHPELQSELEFGIEQAKGASIEAYEDNLRIFLSQGDEWREADGHIRNERDNLKKAIFPGAKNLEETVSLENEYVDAIWHKNYEEAYSLARAILAKLTEPNLRGYRCLWHYLAGSAAWTAYKNGSGGFDVNAREQFTTALKTERSLAWLVPLSKLAVMKGIDTAVLDDKDTWSIVERLESQFDQLGTLTDFKYDKAEAHVQTLLAKNDAKSFEEGHKLLGNLLGYEGGNRNITGSPDPWWMANSSFCFIFEDHSEALETSTLSVDKARQVCTHPNWARENLPINQDSTVIPVLVTPVNKADEAAIPHLKNVYVWKLDEFRQWATEAMATIRLLRKEYPNSGDLMWRAIASEKLTKAHITPDSLLEMLKSKQQLN